MNGGVLYFGEGRLKTEEAAEYPGGLVVPRGQAEQLVQDHLGPGRAVFAVQDSVYYPRMVVVDLEIAADYSFGSAAECNRVQMLYNYWSGDVAWFDEDTVVPLEIEEKIHDLETAIGGIKGVEFSASYDYDEDRDLTEVQLYLLLQSARPIAELEIEQWAKQDHGLVVSRRFRDFKLKPMEVEGPCFIRDGVAFVRLADSSQHPLANLVEATRFDFECETCGAQAGDECRTSSGQRLSYSKFHAGRRNQENNLEIDFHNQPFWYMREAERAMAAEHGPQERRHVLWGKAEPGQAEPGPQDDPQNDPTGPQNLRTSERSH